MAPKKQDAKAKAKGKAAAQVPVAPDALDLAPQVAELDLPPASASLNNEHYMAVTRAVTDILGHPVFHGIKAAEPLDIVAGADSTTSGFKAGRRALMF